MSMDEGTAAEKQATAPHPEADRKPSSPTELTKPSWFFTARSSVAEFVQDQCTDLAAALTYYSVLSVFPGLVALVSLLGVLGQGQSTVDTMMSLLRELGAGDAVAQLEDPIAQMVSNSKGASIGLIIGLVGALWSASNYVNAFGRAMNRIYEIDEGRGLIRLRLSMLIITVLLVLMAASVLLGLVVSGPIASSIGGLIGLDDTAVTIWNIAKWPVILLVVVFMVALLYYGTPNIKQPKFRWLSVGAFIAIMIWVLASVAFGFYVSNFGSYNKTYGSLAGVIVFLLWLWLTNLALLFGAEFDAELERSRQLQAGIEAERTLQLPPRSAKKSAKAERKYEARVAKGRAIRESNGRTDKVRGSAFFED